jgi:hypothetical protein
VDRTRHRWDHHMASALLGLLFAVPSIAACSETGQPTTGSSSGSTVKGDPPRTGGATTGADPTSSPPVSQSRDVETVVTEEDAGKRLLLRPGQRLRVVLGADFQPLAVSDQRVLRPVVASGGYPTGEPAMTVVTAADPGQAYLSSLTDFGCLHEPTPCAMPQRAWTLSLIITAS